jgi:UDP-N-acetylmuramate dehydrogenase
MSADVYTSLETRCKGRVLRNELLSSHTSFRIGGPADCFVWAEDIEDVEAVLHVVSSEKLPFLVVGNGTNLLVDDDGFRGIVMRLGRGFAGLERDETRVTLKAGVNLARALDFCAGHGLSGLEFAVGIPGTIGGALFTGAWTRSGWIQDRVVSATTMSVNKRTIQCEISGFQDKKGNPFHNDVIITEATFQLTSVPEEDIREEMKRLMARRLETQPMNRPSAGCIFKNPEGQSAGRLIDECGCKGWSVGGALVSDKHANFIINAGGARSRDVLELLDRVRERVHQATGISLETEINIIHPGGAKKNDV